MSNAISGMGTKFYRWKSSSSQWEALAEITSINGPSMSRDVIETTSLDTVGGYKTFIGGLREGGDVSLSMNFTHDTYELMKNDFEDDDNQNYMIRLPDDENSTLEFEGMVMEVPLGIETGDRVSADVTIRVSGSVSFISGTTTI